jgi:hypothetical protein
MNYWITVSAGTKIPEGWEYVSDGVNPDRGEYEQYEVVEVDKEQLQKDDAVWHFGLCGGAILKETPRRSGHV